MIRVKLPQLHAGQAEVASSSASIVPVVTGRQWGKTRVGVNLGMRGALSGGVWWWVAPVYQTSEIAWKLIRKVCAQINARAPGLIDVRLGDRAIVLPNGGELLCRSADRPDNLRGGTLDGVIVDEADYCDEYLWNDVLTPALGVREGRAFMFTSARVENGWFHQLWKSGRDDPAERGDVRRDPGVQSFRFPTWASPFFSQKALDAARRRLPQITFRREFGAEFLSGAGAMVRRESLRYGAPARSGLEVVLGVDLAISKGQESDYTAVVALTMDPATGFVYVLDVIRDRVSFRGALAMIESMAQRWRPVDIAIESVAFQAAVVQELLRTTTLPVRGVQPSKDKVLRFQPLAARYEQFLVRHAEGLDPDFERELLAFPLGKHDDMVDAISYAYAAAGQMGARAEVAGAINTFEELNHGDLSHLGAMG